jgi:hypothetical protein
MWQNLIIIFYHNPIHTLKVEFLWSSNPEEEKDNDKL